MATKTVGRFTITDGVITGPAAYMREKGFDRIAAIERGEDVIVNAGYAPDIETAILVSLQTDYAAWAGAKQAAGWAKGGA